MMIAKCCICNKKYTRWNLGEYGYPYKCLSCLKKQKKCSLSLLMGLVLMCLFLIPLVNSFELCLAGFGFCNPNLPQINPSAVTTANGTAGATGATGPQGVAGTNGTNGFTDTTNIAFINQSNNFNKTQYFNGTREFSIFSERTMDTMFGTSFNTYLHDTLTSSDIGSTATGGMLIKLDDARTVSTGIEYTTVLNLAINRNNSFVSTTGSNTISGDASTITDSGNYVSSGFFPTASVRGRDINLLLSPTINYSGAGTYTYNVFGNRITFALNPKTNSTMTKYNYYGLYLSSSGNSNSSVDGNGYLIYNDIGTSATLNNTWLLYNTANISSWLGLNNAKLYFGTTKQSYITYNGSDLIFCNTTDCYTLNTLIQTGADNSSWNQSFANTLYYNISNPKNYINTSYNSTYDAKGVGNILGSGTAGYIPLWNNSNTINNSIIYQNGTKIGIGTTNPSYDLDLSGTFRATSSFIVPLVYASNSFGAYSMTSSGSYYGRIGPTTKTGNGGWYLGHYTDTTSNAGTPVLSWTGDGNVGIGTTNPLNKLVVTGNESAFTSAIYNTRGEGTGHGLLVQTRWNVPGNIVASFKTNSGSNPVMEITGNERVGIKTITPSNTLDVRGDGNFSGTIYINNATDISTLGGNSSWNQSFANTLYLNRTSESLYTSTYNATYAANQGNASWNQSLANTLYAGIQWGYNMTTPANAYADNINTTLSSRIDGISGSNVSWNQTLANTLYAGIQWGYNQTIPANAYADAIVSTNNASWTSTYNATYAANQGNASWNQSLANTLYAGIQWGYNQTTATYDLYNTVWSSTYNATYNSYVTTNKSNSSNYWDNMDTINTTQMQNNGGTLNILQSWINSIVYSITNIAFTNQTNNFTANQIISANLTVTGTFNPSKGYLLGSKTKLNIGNGSGNYTTPTGVKAIYVQVWGGGGAGGGANGTASSVSLGAGGGAGGYSEKWIVSPSAIYNYSVGAGGLGVSASYGDDGNATSFSNLVTANGGGGGAMLAAGTSVAVVQEGLGASLTIYGDISTGGANGNVGIRTGGGAGRSGSGASGLMGRGGYGNSAGGGNMDGFSGSGYASGGGGAMAISNVNQEGGYGAAGLIIIWEYY